MSLAADCDDDATRRADALLAWCRELHFDDAAIVAVSGPAPDAERLREAVAAGRHGPLDWLANTVDIRADVRKRVPNARSVLVTVTSYFAGDHADHVDAETLKGQARIARYAWGSDYHQVLRRRLRKLRKRLLLDAPKATVSLFSDADPVLERGFATAAGLGFIGKSTMLIHRGLGTWTFLAGLVTDLELRPCRRPVQTDHCGTCTRCLDACPTQAFVAPFMLDAARCLSTWTVEAPRAPEAELATGHGWGVGCDVCQEVCPWNRFERETADARFRPRPGHVAYAPDDPPTDLAGTPLARPGAEGMRVSGERALSLRPSCEPDLSRKG